VSLFRRVSTVAFSYQSDKRADKTLMMQGFSFSGSDDGRFTMIEFSAVPTGADADAIQHQGTE
jgi:hypothetical protein